MQHADDVYRQAMATLDTSQLSSAFGPYLTSVNTDVVAGYAARGVRLKITPLGPLVIQGVSPQGPDRAVVTGAKAEDETLVSASGRALQHVMRGNGHGTGSSG